MNRLEFNQVMKAVGINNPLSVTFGRNNTYDAKEDVHYWNNIAINFSGSDYAIVNGTVPLKIIETINDRYPNNNLAITQKNKDRYATYHIQTKEGMLIFLASLKDYYLKKKGLPANNLEKIDYILAEITYEIIKEAKLDISSYDWMQHDQIFNDTILSGNTTSFSRKFREALDTFDKTINPFMSDNLTFDIIANSLKNINISVDIFDRKEGKFRKNCCHMKIVDLATKSEINYYRMPEGFSYQLFYKIDDKKLFAVSHYYRKDSILSYDNGEVISIILFDNNECLLDLRYNITKGLAGSTYQMNSLVTPEQKELIYDELKKAIDYASTITINNMILKEFDKEQLDEIKKGRIL